MVDNDLAIFIFPLGIVWKSSRILVIIYLGASVLDLACLGIILPFQAHLSMDKIAQITCVWSKIKSEFRELVSLTSMAKRYVFSDLFRSNQQQKVFTFYCNFLLWGLVPFAGFKSQPSTSQLGPWGQLWASYSTSWDFFFLSYERPSKGKLYVSLQGLKVKRMFKNNALLLLMSIQT